MTARLVTAADLHAMFQDQDAGVIDISRSWLGELNARNEARVEGDVDFHALAVAVNARLLAAAAAAPAPIGDPATRPDRTDPKPGGGT